ncbi:DUF262 domain-containing protein [Massilia violaceinigra]|uniref:DUF262 domain-containing protein n=1 Tax=Massilia violaceinigra TaxID=2045208 RepID=A0ABY4A825_9BURK|nr:DUF262 domain-containing protein [Massilia violaceinigra]UOD30562.1 DUF262 domain-containing protein [Massilia violaceinigra]
MANKKLTNRELEELYDSGEQRILQERSDFLLPQIIDFVDTKKWLNIRPEYQRRLVWDNVKKSRLIESLIMNVPVPPVFLYEEDLSRYEVMDGQQRLNSIVEFYSNRLKLSGLEEWDGLNGKTYADLPPRLQKGLDRRRISATVLMAESPLAKEKVRVLRRVVFERLNTGGQSLNAQELRNCLYAGGFNDLIVNLVKNRLFNELWDIPPYEDNVTGETISPELAANGLFKRMGDCEIVLRFFSFLENKFIKGSMRSILDKCMERNVDDWNDEKFEAYRHRFITRLELADQIFGRRAFEIVTKRKTSTPGVTKISDKHSPPLFDAVMVAVDRLYDFRTELVVNRKAIVKEFKLKIENDDVFYALIVGRANTAASVRERIDAVEQLFRSHI